MRWHSVNYRAQEGRQRRPRWNLVNVGFWLHGVPRALILCRVFGHKPVVDGYGPHPRNPGGHAARWVACGRCSMRPDPQGRLDPSWWQVGERYTGPYGTQPGEVVPWSPERESLVPGPWPAEVSRGVIGGQLLLGGAHSWSVEFKVGGKGSEATLAAHVCLGVLGALYLHTERTGSWLVNWLNGRGDESKVIGLAVHDGHLWWRLWVNRNAGWSRGQPWHRRVRDGSVRVNPLDVLLGPDRFSYQDVGQPVVTTVRLPHGDDHEVELVLQRQTRGRRRWPYKHQAWHVEWRARGGIPTEPAGRGRIVGSGVAVSDGSVESGDQPPVPHWVHEAAAAIAVRLTEDRRLGRWRAEEVRT